MERYAGMDFGPHLAGLRREFSGAAAKSSPDRPVPKIKVGGKIRVTALQAIAVGAQAWRGGVGHGVEDRGHLFDHAENAALARA